ncbi:MAG: hypothetical protein LBV79_10945, partial [Candidatus Adiutrix sp.]|nr:hypothetical protein [Candidatus Adiutrix sp.]
MKALAGNDKTVTIEFSRHEFNLLRRMWDAFLKDPFPQELPTLTGKTLAQITSFKKQIDEIAARYDFDEEYVAKDISEIFQRYDVPADMSHRVFFAKLVHENGSLSITVTHENNPQNQFLIFFDGMNSYRHIDEGDELEV